MDFEIVNQDRSQIINNTAPYDDLYMGDSHILTKIGVNWSELGLTGAPAELITAIGYVNDQNQIGDKGCLSYEIYLACPSIVPISVSNTAGKYVATNYLTHYYEPSGEHSFRIQKYEYSSPGPLTVFLLKSINGSYTPSDYDASPLRANWDKPFTESAEVVVTGNYNQLTTLTIQAIKNYFYSSGFSFDATIDSESLGVDDDNASFTVLNWGNLQHTPSGHTPSDYSIAVKIVGHVSPLKAQLFSNKSEKLEFTYEMLYNDLNPNEIADADSNGYIDISVFIYHARPGIVDAYHNVRVYPNGNMTLLYETAPGHLTVNPNTSPYFNGVYRGGTGTLIQQVPGQEMSIDNLLTISYAMDDNELKAFGAWIWENSNPMSQLNETQVAPIENVISCKRIPFTVPNIDEEVQKIDVHCGNRYVEVSGTRLQAYPALSTHRWDVGVFQIPVYSGDYLDFENNVSIYLPYIGIQSIPTSLCYKRTLKNAKDGKGNNITDKDSQGHTYTVQVPEVTGRKLGVVYYYDIIYGSCCALLYIDGDDDNPVTWDSTTSTVSGGNLIAAFNGDCGVDIPVTASNRASNELALRKTGDNMLTGVVAGAVGGAMAGGLTGALAGALTAGIGGALNYRAQERNQEIHYTTSGGFSSQVASYMTKTVTLFVEHSTYDSRQDDPETYGHENGYPCNLSMKMRSLRGLGYSELSGEIEISGDIPCYEEERLELKKALTEGFYVSTNKIVKTPQASS